jgi:hypothetical protein
MPAASRPQDAVGWITSLELSPQARKLSVQAQEERRILRGLPISLSRHGVPGGIARGIGVKARYHPVKHANALHLGQLQQPRFKDFNRYSHGHTPP